MIEFFLKSDIKEIVNCLGSEVQIFAGKRILLCGGNGFLGRYFVAVFQYLNDEILRKPCRLKVVDNLISSSIDSLPFSSSNLFFVNHNITEPLSDWGTEDYIIHAAGIASPVYYCEYPLETIDVSTIGTRNLLKLAMENKARFLFFSSSEVYGDPLPEYIPTPETYRGNVSCLGSRACYDESKRLGETISKVYFNLYDIPVNIVRPFNVYGPGMKPNDCRILPNFASSILRKVVLQIYGSGNQTRTYCYVADAIVGFLKILLNGKPGEVYNIGNDKPEISVFDLIDNIEHVLSRKIPFEKVNYPDSYPSDEPSRRCPDISKAKRDLSYVPQVDLQDGLKRFFGWAQKNYPLM